MTSAVTIVCNVATIRGTFNQRIILQTEMTDGQMLETAVEMFGHCKTGNVRAWFEAVAPDEVAAIREEGIRQGHADSMGGGKP